MHIPLLSLILVLSLVNGLVKQTLATPVPVGSRNSSPTRRPSSPVGARYNTSTSSTHVGEFTVQPPPVKNKQYHTTRAVIAKDDVELSAKFTKKAFKATGQAIARNDFTGALSGAVWTCAGAVACAARGVGYAHHKNKAKNLSE